MKQGVLNVFSRKKKWYILHAERAAKAGAVLGLSLFGNVFSLQAQTVLSADGPGDTYELIESVLGRGTASETPDCAHGEFGRHITEEYDQDLGKNVFAFFMHVNPDNDRCSKFDRQRNEIKTFGPSREELKGGYGETHTYRWKFKLDAGFQPTTSFTHIHQIKAGNGADDDNPIITLTPRAGNPQRLEVIFIPSKGNGVSTKVATTSLVPFKGAWVEVYEKIKYAENGTYELVIKRVSDGAVLLSYSNSNLDMWRGDATFNRPKWGVYRSLTKPEALRDEKVLFADFSIEELNEAPVAQFSASRTSGYTPVNVSFDASATTDINLDSLQYNWNFGDGTVASGKMVEHTFTTPGVYTATVTVTDGRGGSSSASTTVTVENAAPVAQFTLSDSTGFAPLAPSFDASASTDLNGDSLTYAWDFGDGATATGKSVSHTYIRPGSFTAVLTVTDPWGASHSATAQVEVAPGLKLQYQVKANGNKATDNHIRPHFQLVNIGDKAVPYNELTVRYWYTRENAEHEWAADNTSQSFWCDYAALGTNLVKGKFVKLQSPVDSANYYLEVSFTSAAALAPGLNSGEIQTRFNNANWSDYNETGDYSYGPSSKDYYDWSRITVYRNGQLIWGTEPSTVTSVTANAENSSLSAESEESSLAVYPNPMVGHALHLSTELTTSAQTQVTIHDYMGNLVYQKNLGMQKAGAFNHTIEALSLSTGAYVVRLVTGTTVRSATITR